MKHFDSFTLMLDMSRNKLMNVKSVKKMINLLEKIGYTSLMLYTEDTYEINDNPYFGYMRGRYSKEELKEIVSYGNKHHIELIPCIQTLAHLPCMFKNHQYQNINDINDILLVDEDETYQLIEKMFESLEECFTCRKVHIGMDEAHMLGLGKYKDIHGIEDRTELFIRHLHKVNEIAKKHGFETLMWSDMFMRLACNGEYYVSEDKITNKQKIIDANIETKQVYWDYYHRKKEEYEGFIDCHKKIFGDDIYYASGIWTWAGFAPLNEYAFKIVKPGIEAAKEKNVRNIIVTAWGDNGGECSFFSALPSIYYAKEIAEDVSDIEQIKKDFKCDMGYSFDDFMMLDLPNKIENKRTDSERLLVNPSKYLLYSDPLLGKLDSKAKQSDELIFAKNGADLIDKSKSIGEYGYLFEYLGNLCNLLSYKCSLGKELRESYKRHLSFNESKIDECIGRLDKFMESYRNLWSIENKPFGFEVQQIRLGGLKERLLETKRKVYDYTHKNISVIEEFEIDVLPIDDNDEPVVYNDYQSNATANLL